MDQFYTESQPRAISIINRVKVTGDEEEKLPEATLVDTGHGFSKTDNRHLATDSGSPTNAKKDKYKEI